MLVDRPEHPRALSLMPTGIVGLIAASVFTVTGVWGRLAIDAAIQRSLTGEGATWSTENPLAVARGHLFGFSATGAVIGALVFVFASTAVLSWVKDTALGHALLRAVALYAIFLVLLNLIVWAFHIPVLHSNPFELRIWLDTRLGLPPIVRLPTTATNMVDFLVAIGVLHVPALLLAATSGHVLGRSIGRAQQEKVITRNEHP